MRNQDENRIIASAKHFFILLFYVLFFVLFYYKYVPLQITYQIALVPILLIAVILTMRNPRDGILYFVFSFPLINNLPSLFGIHQNIPHAPTALVLCLALGLGFLFHSLYKGLPVQEQHSLFKSLRLLSVIIALSCLITNLRFLNFFPFLSQNSLELIANLDGVRSGGAVMSSLFGALNYLTGFFVFWIIFRYVRTDELRKKLVGVFCAATFLVVAFALVQKFISLELGNTAVFIHLERLNSTLKDPNSLGIFLAASFPVLLGYALSVTKKARIPIAALLVLILYIFPDAGSRSGMLGLVVALVVFLVLWQVKQNWDKKKRALLYLAALSISTVLISSYALFFKDTNLISRLGDNVRQFKGEIVVPEMGIAMGRQYLWRIGIEMFEESPVTGMGLGAYIIDLPNFAE